MMRPASGTTSGIATRWASTMRAACRRRRDAGGALRLFSRPVAGDDDRAHVPCRQRLLAARMSAHSLAPAARPIRFQHRLPRLRRAAGHGRHRGRDRRDRSQLGRDPLDVRGRNFYGEGGDMTPYAQEVDGKRLRRAARPSWSATSDYRARREEIDAFNAANPILKKRDRADAGEIRHLLHHHAPEPGRGAGARLYRRLGAPEPRRHRDGSGAVHQGRPGRGRRIPGRPRPQSSITATSTAKVPNTSPTAASSGSDLNGMGGAEAASTHQAAHGRLRRRAVRAAP